MKRSKLLFLTLALIIVVLLTITACGKKDTEKNEDDGKETDAQETVVKELDDTPDIKDNVLTFREGDGVAFDQYHLYMTEGPLAQLPQTFEAWVKLPEDVSGGVGAIMGDYTGNTAVSLLLQIKENGVPELYYRLGASATTRVTATFDTVKLPTKEWVHVAFVDDVTNGTISCYVNGTLAQTVTLTDVQKTLDRAVADSPMCIGGDTRTGNELAFDGSIRSLTLYKDTRTADEIKADMTSINLNDEDLMSCYDISNSQGKAVFTDHKNAVNFIDNRSTEEWLEPSEVPAPTDYDYSIALIGDTQILAGYIPQAMPSIFDWLIKNKDSHKIAHVLNLGDFTNFNYDEEWELCVNQYFRLNGVIDYTLVRGDHDVLDDRIPKNGDDSLKYDRYFGVDAYLSRFNNDDSGYFKSDNDSITNSYRRVKIGNTHYLILTLDNTLSDAVATWAKGILSKYPDDKVIMTTHRYMDKSMTKSADGKAKWAMLSGFKNVQFCICGHSISENVVWKKEAGKQGNIINQVLVNPQGAGMDNNGATGMVCMLYFKEGSDDVQVRYYSTVLDKYYSWDNQFTMNIADKSQKVLLK